MSDLNLHRLGAAIIMAVCIAADIAAPGVVWAGVVFNAAFWPGREWLQHRHRQKPWTDEVYDEAFQPVAVGLILAGLWSIGRAALTVLA